jgi:hypothetical protein
MQHPTYASLITASPTRRGAQGILPSASPKGGSWHIRPADNASLRCHPAWPLRHASFFRTSRWRRPGCIPPLKIAKFEQDVLYEHGLAQVGFDVVFLSSFLVSPFTSPISTELRVAAAHAVGRAVASRPPPPRCRDGVNSPYLPA